MLSREKRTGYKNLFQIREERAYRQELQRKRDDEEEKGLGRARQ